jgi:hypothetical protein
MERLSSNCKHFSSGAGVLEQQGVLSNARKGGIDRGSTTRPVFHTKPEHKMKKKVNDKGGTWQQKHSELKRNKFGSDRAVLRDFFSLRSAS